MRASAELPLLVRLHNSFIHHHALTLGPSSKGHVPCYLEAYLYVFQYEKPAKLFM